MKKKNPRKSDVKANDPVNHPAHYTQYPMQCIEVLKVLLTEEEYRGFCLGNSLKYRWRKYDKSSYEQDMAKADFYFNEYLKSIREIRED